MGEADISPNQQQELGYNVDEKAAVREYKGDAIHAEDQEHDMGVIEAARAYPAATFWAFVMSFTIVSAPNF